MAQPAQKIPQQSMAQQKVASLLSEAQKSESLWNGFLVFVATLMLLSTVNFFPLYVVIPLAVICGAISSKVPPFGIIIGAILALPGVMYQSAVFAWFYILILVLILFEVFENWMLLAVLEVLILAPFAFGGLPFSGFVTIIGMAMGALYFGSKKSAAISVFAVTTILLLSSVWLVQNTAYMPIKNQLYTPAKPELQFSKKPVDLGGIGGEMAGAFGRFFDFENITRIWESLAFVADNFIRLLIGDSLVLQLIGWGAALYLVGYLPTKLKPRPQLMSAFALLLLIPVYFLVSMVYSVGFLLEFPVGIVIAIAVLGTMEYFGLNISRESEIGRKEKMKAYGKFGMTDMSAGGEEKSMADVGGYEDVKQELRDAIIMPLEKKEIAFTYGIKPPTGILLFGPPGTGKTMLMRALAKELKYNFIEVKCSQILSQWYGESEKNVAEVFDNARKNAPTVLFFDEIDAVGKKRSAESLDEVGQRVLSELLQQIDGASKSKATVMIVGATNRPDSIDTAMLRPGRLDKIIYMHLPDPEARKAIINVNLRGLPVAQDVDRDVLARKTERFSGADMKNVVTEAKRLAAKEATAKGVVVPLSMAHFLQVLSYVKPSTSLAMLDTYEQFKLDFERRVGAEKPKEEEAAKEAAVKWEDVAGLDQVKQALLEAIELPLLHEAEMKEFKVKPSKGILLFGPPGTGKTLIVKAAASELKASFQSLSAAEIMKKGYTQAVTVIKEAFNRARENPPGIIFVDEIETFAPARGSGGSSEILGQFLTEMDGVKGKAGVVVMAATNKPVLMDPAIMRPGRFDKIFYIPPPDEMGREDMFKIHLGKFAPNVDLKVLAEMTPGFSGADIADICQNAKMRALRAKLAGAPEAISTQTVVDIIRTRRPSITPQILDEYRKFLEAYGERR
ncbi:MAG TPA: AAA family ATPase [Candidatus Bilamarchaeum sp.]|nr:AAA family ATPase [Candidatus Bilamarchaeum sp.]